MLHVQKEFGTALTVQTVGLTAARYNSALGIFQALRSRLNTLLLVRSCFAEQFEDFDEHQTEGPPRRTPLGLANWTFKAKSQEQRADRDLHRRRQLKKLDQIDEQITDVRDWLSRLDRNNTIDHRPPFASEVRSYLARWSVQRLLEYTGLTKPKSIPDIWAEKLAKQTLVMRQAEYIQRLDVEICQAVEKGWYVVFDTLTIDPEREDAFLADRCAIRDHTRRLGRLVNKALGRRVRDPHSDVFRYFAVPEYGKKGGRLHFHVVYLMAALPRGCVDPNIGRRVRNRREIRALKLWGYGFSAPIAVRYSGDAFSSAGWLWPVDKKGKPLETKPPIAVAKYMSKYVSKSFEERETWLKNSNSSPRRAFRIRMTRQFGLMLDLSTLSHRALWEMTCLHHSVTPRNRLLRKLALKRMSYSLGKTSINDFLELLPAKKPLLECLRALTREAHLSSPLNFTDMMTPKLRNMDLSEESRAFIDAIPRFNHNAPLSAK